MPRQDLEHRNFLILLAVVSLAFGWILWPLFGGLFWAVVLSVLFWPVNAKLLRHWPQRHNLAALLTLMLSVVLVILPATLLIAALAEQATGLVVRMRDGQFDVGRALQQILGLLPSWLLGWLQERGLADLAGLQAKLSAAALQISQFAASQVLQIGQNAAQFAVSVAVMLYLMFFLLRDGRDLRHLVSRAIPLDHERKQVLFKKFTTVIRATVKGNLVVAAVQGVLGGVIFAVLGVQGTLLWAVLMGVLSLLPAVGAGLVWLPVSLYFLATGAIWQGVVLIAFGVLVIGLVDNLLRPVLVGKDTRMPDYVVMISTLGGLAVFGLNGFVIGPLIAALFMAAWTLHIQPPANDGS